MKPASRLSVVLCFLLFVSGCRYTIVKEGPPQSMGDLPDFLSWAIDSLCTTWRGVVVEGDPGTGTDIAEIYGLTLNHDTTWAYENDRGLVNGRWSIDERHFPQPTLYLTLYPAPSKRQTGMKFVVNFVNGGMILTMVRENRNALTITWYLVPYK